MIEGHSPSYIGCKSTSSANLHEEAFFPEGQRGILSYMARKATYIRAWRDEKGFTLEDMVGRLAVLGVDTTGASLSRIERGIQPYSQDTLEAIADALDVSVAQLIEDNPELPPAKILDFVRHLSDIEAAQADKVLRAMFGERAAAKE